MQNYQDLSFKNGPTHWLLYDKKNPNQQINAVICRFVLLVFLTLYDSLCMNVNVDIYFVSLVESFKLFNIHNCHWGCNFISWGFGFTSWSGLEFPVSIKHGKPTMSKYLAWIYQYIQQTFCNALCIKNCDLF